MNTQHFELIEQYLKGETIQFQYNFQNDNWKDVPPYEVPEDIHRLKGTDTYDFRVKPPEQRYQWIYKVADSHGWFLTREFITETEFISQYGYCTTYRKLDNELC